MKGISTKKLIIGVVIIGFLALVGLVRVVAVIGDSLFGKGSNKSVTATQTNATTTKVDTPVVVKSEAEKQKENESYKKEMDRKDQEYKNNQVQLPTSNIVRNTNFNRQGTRGVVNINGNYYVGYYCGLKEIFEAAVSAESTSMTMKVMKDRGEMDDGSGDYQLLLTKVKDLTPYIKDIQDMDMKTSDPYKIKDLIHNYILDTVRMNMRGVIGDHDMQGHLAEAMFERNGSYFDEALLNGKKAVSNNDLNNYLNKLDENKYPALNENILE